MDKKTLLGSIGALALTLGYSGLSAASLVGDTITATGNSLGPGSATIDNTVEFTAIFDGINLDFDGSTLRLSAGPNYNGLFVQTWSFFGDFVFSDFDRTITGLTLGANRNITGTLLTDFSFTDDSITFNMTQGSMDGLSAFLVYNIESEPSTVPVPAAAWLFGSGLIGLAAVARRKRTT